MSRENQLIHKISHNHSIKQVSTDFFTIFSDIHNLKQVNSPDFCTKISENHKLKTSIYHQLFWQNSVKIKLKNKYIAPLSLQNQWPWCRNKNNIHHLHISWWAKNTEVEEKIWRKEAEKTNSLLSTSLRSALFCLFYNQWAVGVKFVMVQLCILTNTFRLHARITHL